MRFSSLFWPDWLSDDIPNWESYLFFYNSFFENLAFLWHNDNKPLKMKIYFAAFCLLTASSFVSQADAQVSLSVSVNVASQPSWGPSGYDNVNYYYMPDIETYYYVPKHQFIYLNGGNWVFATTLPPRYHSYDLYRGYKVVINDPQPYMHHDHYRDRYAHYRAYYDHQPVLRDHRDDGPGNGHGKGHAYGHDKDDKHEDKDHGHRDHND